MACLISELTVSGVDDGAGGAASITVMGLAEDCASGRVLVKLFCGGAPVGAISAAIVDGRWSATFDDEPPCLCGNDVHVEVECEGSPGCRTVADLPLVCSPPEGLCPAVDEVSVDVGGCEDGLRHVSFTITTNAADAAAAELEFGDGDSDAFAVAAGIDVNVVEHRYAAGVYAPSIGFVLPEGCPPVALDAIEVAACCLGQDEVSVEISGCLPDGTREVTFAFPARVSGTLAFGDGEQAGFDGLAQTHAYRPRDAAYAATLTIDGCAPIEIPVVIDACPADCLGADEVTVVVGEACDAERRRAVTLTFARAITGEIDFGDGSPVQVLDGDGGVGHDYPARVSPTNTFVATVRQEGDCEPLEIEVAVPACPCVTAEDIEVVADAECDGDGRRGVTLEFPWVIAAEIDWGDGAAVEPVVAASARHLYLPRDAAYHVTLDVEGCAPVTVDVAVAACGGGGGGGEDDDCGDLKLVVGALLGLALAATLLLVALQFCFGVGVPWFVWLIPVALVAAAAVVVAIWAAFCDPPTRCDWLAIAWMVTLTGGLVALYLSGCCGGLMLGIAVGLFFVATLFFAAWLAECRPSLCEVLAALAVTLASAAGGILSAIGVVAAFVPPMLNCLLWWVAAAVGGLVAILVPLALACED